MTKSYVFSSMLCLMMWLQTTFNKLVEITILAISSLTAKKAKYYDQNLHLSSMLCLMMWFQTAVNKIFETTTLVISLDC